MSPSRDAFGLVLAGAAALGLFAGRDLLSAAPAAVQGPVPSPIAGQRPAPTEHWLGVDAEGRNKTRRKAFVESIHRSAPGADWRQIERGNGLRQISKRNGIPPPAEGEGSWTERGSENQAGRTHVSRLSADGRTLFVGSALGGLWMGPLDGSDWQPIGDNLYGGAHWLEVIPGDAGRQILVAGTDGGALHVSPDLGATWTAAAGLGSLYRIRRLTMPRNGEGQLYVVVDGWDGPSLRRSDDGGANFTQIANLVGMQGDVWTPRDGGDTLYLAGAGGRLLVSEDGGDSFIPKGVIDAAAGRIELTGSEAGAPTLYAVADGLRLYRSDDAGDSWASLGEISDYWGALNASMVDDQLFVFGGMELWISRDGGASFAKKNAWGDYYSDPANRLHADVMGIDVEPDGETEHWYVHTDGGVYRSSDGLVTVDNLALRGLRISQYYDVLTSSADPSHIAAGAQDQGYQVTKGVESDSDRLRFNQIISGDYGHLTSGDGSHDLVYSVYPGFTLVQIGEDDPELSYLDWPPVENRNIWMPAIVADPSDNAVFYFPGDRIYRYERTSHWEWAPTLHSEQDFEGRDGEYVSAMVFSPVDPDRVYAATSLGRVWVSDDHGVSWEQTASVDAGEHWLYGHALLASAEDRDRVYVGGSGYSNPAVYRSDDGGQSWTAWGQGLPQTHVYMLAEARDGSGRVAAATETAAYLRDEAQGEWADITGNAAPVTLYWSVEALHDSDVFRFGTYGRGIWDYSLPPWEPASGDEGDGGDAGDDGGDGGTDDGEGSDDGAGVTPATGGEDPGCGCSSTRRTPPAWPGLALLLGIVAGALRRRRR